jgi:hypothetical protein
MVRFVFVGVAALSAESPKLVTPPAKTEAPKAALDVMRKSRLFTWLSLRFI